MFVVAVATLSILRGVEEYFHDSSWLFSRACLDFVDIWNCNVGDVGGWHDMQRLKIFSILLNSTEAWWPKVWRMAGIAYRTPVRAANCCFGLEITLLKMNERVPWKRTILKGNEIIQPTIFSGYVTRSFQGLVFRGKYVHLSLSPRTRSDITPALLSLYWEDTWEAANLNMDSNCDKNFFWHLLRPGVPLSFGRFARAPMWTS